MKRFLSVLIASMFLASAAYAAEEKGKGDEKTTEAKDKAKGDTKKVEAKDKAKGDTKKVEAKDKAKGESETKGEGKKSETK
jgi:Ni/Co efflux regulator RcnB